MSNNNEIYANENNINAVIDTVVDNMTVHTSDDDENETNNTNEETDIMETIPSDVLSQIKAVNTKAELMTLFKEMKGRLSHETKKCMPASFHTHLDYFVILAANTTYIDLIRFTVCDKCAYANLKHVVSIRLTFGDQWYHSINEQDEPLCMTKYAKSVLSRAINKEKYKNIIEKALVSDMRYDNCNRPNVYHSWTHSANMNKLIKSPYNLQLV